MVKEFGVDHVGIGTDVAYTSRTQEAVDAKMPPRRKRRPRWAGFWPGDSSPAAVEPVKSQSMAWTNWPLFTVGLVQRGHSDEDIRKILGGNMLRVARDVWPGD